jgi:histidyl-tRNA synthetase
MLADLGLRYDLTVPLARAVAAHRGKLPAILKRYQIQPVWRADTPGKGRYREFYQCDVDVVGTQSPLADTEVLGAVCAALGKLGFDDFTVRINHRQLLRAICEVAGVPKGREGDALVAIDKLDKIGTEGVVKELAARGVSDPQRVLDIAADATLDSLAERLSDHEAGTAAIANLREVMALAADTPAGNRLQFDAALARGLGYYTGCIFEIRVADLAGSLAGGGRYDGLVGSFGGNEAPACGFSIGLERILVVMEERNMYPDDLGGADVLLGAADTADLGAALGLATRLRASGLRVDLSPEAVSPGKLRKQTDARGLRAAVWLERDGGGRANAWLRTQGDTHRDLDGDGLVELLGAGSEA